jgi:hypothetical protein
VIIDLSCKYLFHQFSLFFFFTYPWQAIEMLWSTSLPLLSSSLLALVTRGLAVPHAGGDKHYAIMDNDWYTAGFVPYLVALDGDVEILGLASGEWSKLGIQSASYDKLR